MVCLLQGIITYSDSKSLISKEVRSIRSIISIRQIFLLVIHYKTNNCKKMIKEKKVTSSSH